MKTCRKKNRAVEKLTTEEWQGKGEKKTTVDTKNGCVLIIKVFKFNFSYFRKRQTAIKNSFKLL